MLHDNINNTAANNNNNNNNNNTKYTRKHVHHHVTHNNNMVTVTDRERTTTAVSTPLNKSTSDFREDLYFSATEDDEEMLCSKCRFVYPRIIHHNHC